MPHVESPQSRVAPLIRKNRLASRALAGVAVLSAALCLATVRRTDAQSPPAAGARPAAFTSEEAKADAIGKVRLLADQIDALRSDTARVRGLGALARASCNFDKDFALQTFHRAHQVVQRASASDAAALRRTLVPDVARCDGDLAYKLNSEAREDAGDTSANSGALADLQASRAMLNENPALAGRFLKRAMQSQMSEPEAQHAVQAMMELRAKDGAAADGIFLAVLARLRAELRPEAKRLLLIGHYLFTSPPFPGVPEELMANAVVRTSVGAGRRGAVATYNLVADRPGMNPALVRPYLETAFDILSRPIQDPSQQAADFVALYQLMEKVPRFAPDLATQFALLRERLSPNVTGLLRDPASYKVLNDMNSGPSIDDRIRAERDPVKRDAMRLRSLEGGATRNSTNETRKRVSEIEDKDLREQALLLLQFFDAAKAVAEGRLPAAEEAARAMPPGVKRALLALSLAAALHGKGERDRAESWWKIAFADAQTSDYAARANLLLAVTAIGMPFDREAALVALDAAVTSFNRSEESEMAHHRTTDDALPRNGVAAKSATSRVPTVVRAFPFGFLQEIYFGENASQFRLRAPGVDTSDFTPALMNGIGREVERAHAIVTQLADESLRASALASLARPYFENATKKPEQAAATRP